ncbi:MAG: leucine-rich repeat domain-containing protein, partial [Egibacteraceae bacterium]
MSPGPVGDKAVLEKILHAASSQQGALSLAFNQLTALPPQIGQLANLQTLDLRGNQLTALPAELGDLPETLLLALDGNPLREPLPQLVERGLRELFAYLRSLAR